MVAHRKQGPVLPTLVISINDKGRKRRSSRAAGLITSKESSSATLWFRNPPDDHHPSLHEWARFILSKKLPMSPESPASPSFTNPFASRQRDASDYLQRPPSNQNSRTGPNHKGSSHTHSSRDRPGTFDSESPSLRSKRSDISSPSSSTYPPQTVPFPGQHYTTVLPSDLPSPVGTVGDYPGEFIEGWTAAQGRSSNLGSPIQGRGSVSSQSQGFPLGADSSSPPCRRETILDRAFQLRCIPGSDREMIPGEEKLTSLARFDALMRESDERRKDREAAAGAEEPSTQSAWDLESSGESDDEEDEEEEPVPTVYERRRRNHAQSAVIPPSAQRALEFIAERHGPRSPRSPDSPQFDTVSMRTLTGPTRPHTAHSKSRPNLAHRAISQSQLAPVSGNTNINHSLDVPSSSSGRTSEEMNLRPTVEKRQSSSSTKRLSFTEFTKRLSSTSSLLLVQTNASGGSSRSSEADHYAGQSALPAPRGSHAHLNTRGAPPPFKDREREEWERRCGWRGSVGVFGAAEGGFL